MKVESRTLRVESGSRPLELIPFGCTSRISAILPHLHVRSHTHSHSRTRPISLSSRTLSQALLSFYRARYRSFSLVLVHASSHSLARSLACRSSAPFSFSQTPTFNYTRAALSPLPRSLTRSPLSHVLALALSQALGRRFARASRARPLHRRCCRICDV